MVWQLPKIHGRIHIQTSSKQKRNACRRLSKKLTTPAKHHQYMAKRGKRAHPEAWHHMLHQGLKTTRPLETIPIHSEYMRPRQDRVNAAIAINYEWINQFVHTNHMGECTLASRSPNYSRHQQCPRPSPTQSRTSYYVSFPRNFEATNHHVLWQPSKIN